MCLIVVSIANDPRYPMLVAANRDEFFRRPTRDMHWWHEREILAGRDEQSGGTWLAVTPDARVAAVTNVREGTAAAGHRSRGELPLMALEQKLSSLKVTLKDNPAQWSGFNLVVVSAEDGWYFSNRDAHPGRQLHRGIFGLSNHLLETPWPKLLRLRNAVGAQLSGHQGPTDQLHRTLINTLRDDTPAPDRDLPDTGVGLDMERFLSSPFVRGEHYGTRASTIVTLDRNNQVTVTEQIWGPEGRAGNQQQFTWRRQSPPSPQQ
ncbi:MAG: NRDE family protein [Pseudomonadota bacterium]|nr:NRDE family protein [Pseudomonadota bacterium]